MKPDDLPHAVRIGVWAREPWAAAGLVAQLGSGPLAATWSLQPLAAAPAFDALVLHEPDAAVWSGVPPLLPAVAIGGSAPPGGRALALLAAGAEPARVQAALAALLQGLAVHDPARPAERPGAPAAGADDAEPLTERELQVLELIAKGLTNRDIGGLLGISAHTVKFHVAQLLAKLGAASRAEAVSSALRFGLIGV